MQLRKRLGREKRYRAVAKLLERNPARVSGFDLERAGRGGCVIEGRPRPLRDRTLTNTRSASVWVTLLLSITPHSRHILMKAKLSIWAARPELDDTPPARLTRWPPSIGPAAAYSAFCGIHLHAACRLTSAKGGKLLEDSLQVVRRVRCFHGLDLLPPVAERDRHRPVSGAKSELCRAAPPPIPHWAVGRLVPRRAQRQPLPAQRRTATTCPCGPPSPALNNVPPPCRGWAFGPLCSESGGRKRAKVVWRTPPAVAAGWPTPLAAPCWPTVAGGGSGRPLPGTGAGKAGARPTPSSRFQASCEAGSPCRCGATSRSEKPAARSAQAPQPSPGPCPRARDNRSQSAASRWRVTARPRVRRFRAPPHCNARGITQAPAAGHPRAPGHSSQQPASTPPQWIRALKTSFPRKKTSSCIGTCGKTWRRRFGSVRRGLAPHRHPARSLRHRLHHRRESIPWRANMPGESGTGEPGGHLLHELRPPGPLRPARLQRADIRVSVRPRRARRTSSLHSAAVAAPFWPLAAQRPPCRQGESAPRAHSTGHLTHHGPRRRQN